MNIFTKIVFWFLCSLNQVVTKDLQELGYMFSWQKLDARSFLLRQRRLRVWGVADLMSEVNPANFCDRMKKTIDSMSGNELLQFDKVFDTHIPKAQLSSETQREKMRKVIEQVKLKSSDPGATPNVFMDLATGKDRNPEFAEHVSTCVRPSHKVYSNILGRQLCVKELWNCQGLFESAFPNPDAFHTIMEKPRDAQDLAGHMHVQRVLVHMFNMWVLCFQIYIIYIYIYTYIYIYSLDI